MLKAKFRELCDMARVLERQRKRKMEPHLQQPVSGDNTSVCAKSSKVCKCRRTIDHFYPSGHVSTVYLGAVAPKFKAKHQCNPAGDNTESPSTSSASASPSSPKPSSTTSTSSSSTTSHYKPFRFECGLGDIWQERYSPTPSQAKGRRKSKVSTGDYDFDAVATKLRTENHLVTRELISHTKHTSVVLCSSQEHTKDIVLKYMKEKGTSSSSAAAGSAAQQTPPGKRTATGGTEVTTSITGHAEVALLRQLHHSNIVKMLDVKSFNNIHVIMLEFCDNGNLEGLIKAMPNGGLLGEHVSRKYLTDITAGVEYLHSQSIAHCALSSKHILLDQRNRARICGLGHAVRHTARQSTDAVMGAMDPQPPVSAYQAPEIMMKEPVTDPRKLDVWSCGVLLYKMLTGHYIFGVATKKIPTKAAQGPSLAIDRSIYFLTNPLHTFLERVLTFNPEDRPSIVMLRKLEWINVKETKLRLGYGYLVSRPSRGMMSTIEKSLKESHGI